MSPLEIVGAVIGWCCMAYAVASLWHVFHKKQRRVMRPASAGYTVQVGPPKCRCGICTGQVRLPLAPQDVANVQASVLAVVGGVTRVVAGAADYMTDHGVGRVAIVVCDDAMFTSVVEPAIRAHLAATRSST